MLLPFLRWTFLGQAPVSQTPDLPLGTGSHHVHFLDLKEDAVGGLIPALCLFPFPVQNGESERAFICELL